MTRRVIFLLLVLLAVSLACAFPTVSRPTSAPEPTPEATSTPIPTSTVDPTADAEQLQQQLATASSQFEKTGNLEVTLTEQQLTSYLVDALAQQSDFQVSEPQVRLQDGQIQISGKTILAKVSVPVQIIFKPSVEEGILKLQVVSANFGMFPIPDKILTQITDLVNQNLNENLTVDGQQVKIDKIEIAAGKMTVSGKAR